MLEVGELLDTERIDDVLITLVEVEARVVGNRELVGRTARGDKVKS